MFRDGTVGRPQGKHFTVRTTCRAQRRVPPALSRMPLTRQSDNNPPVLVPHWQHGGPPGRSSPKLKINYVSVKLRFLCFC